MPEESPILFDFPLRPPRPAAATSDERELPVVPLINTVLFPHMLTPLFVGRERSVAAVEEAMAADRAVLAVAQQLPEAEDVGPNGLYDVGVEAVIQRILKMPDGSVSVVLQGQRRVRVLAFGQDQPVLRARVAGVAEAGERTVAVEALVRAVLGLFERVVKLSRSVPDDAFITAMNVEEPGWLADLIGSTLPLDVAQRQEILETLDPEERLRRLSTLLTQELDVLELEHRINSQVQSEVDRSQREFFLREQMKAIQRELGQSDPAQRDMALLRERVDAAALPERVARKAGEELERMEAMSPASPEYSVLRTYLDWLIDVPWTSQTADDGDLRHAQRVLERNHYALQPVKERILEFMAARLLAGPRLKAPILCFAGPPGVGKTSLGRSIAEALGRRFVRVSLGGVHDEAEIRGHRRTYVGAMPGRVLKAMKDAGTVNPVFLLDELDKVGSDFRGDPAAALLEVLDPEQNASFTDHYFDVAYDLSRVMFIATANLLDTVPPALRDRLEVIPLPGYSEDEKLEIARRFLVPRQIEANGLMADQGQPTTGERPQAQDAEQGEPPVTLGLLAAVRFSDTALRRLIRDYTYEAGVRGLEREIGAVCRKLARRAAERRQLPRMVTPAIVERLLGRQPRAHGVAEERDEVGVATGLSWTAGGGDVMAIEVSTMKGRGQLALTGQLGEVMRESAQAALTFARSNAEALGIKAKRFEANDVHIHVPAGGVPKDGPSAGIALATALISAFTGRAVRRDVAMTGEITLRGRVLPVGGVKEKVLGAHRAGIATVILPRRNERDLDEVPANVKRRMRFVAVDRMDEVLAAALCPLGAPLAEPAEG